MNKIRKKPKSNAMASIHETMEGLHKSGIISAQTMRQFDEACLTDIRPMTAKQIRALRVREHVSQAVFAAYLNVTPGLVSQWERGAKHPAGPSLKLLSLVDKKGLSGVA